MNRQQHSQLPLNEPAAAIPSKELSRKLQCRQSKSYRPGPNTPIMRSLRIPHAAGFEEQPEKGKSANSPHLGHRVISDNYISLP